MMARPDFIELCSHGNRLKECSPCTLRFVDTPPGDRGGADAEDGLVVEAPTNPMAVARQFLAARYSRDGVDLLRHHRGDFHAWDGRCWPEVEERTVREIVPLA